MRRIVQRSDTYIGLLDDLVRLLPAYGFHTGCIVFHPWRLSGDGTLWEFSPHFHAVGYGMFDNNRLRRDLASADASAGGIWNDDGKGESWVFNQIHAGEEMRSIRHTLGYIMTHVGIGSFHHSVDWIDEADRISIPIEPGGGTQQVARAIDPLQYSVDWRSTRYYGEHPEEVDWVEWTKHVLTCELQSYRVFGKANRQRVVSRYQEFVTRTCPDCGADIALFRGFLDRNPEPVRYQRMSVIRCMDDDFDTVSTYWKDNGERFRDSGYTQLDFAMSVPQCSTPETKGTQTLEANETVDQRRERRDRCLIYLPSIHGQGLGPKVVTRDEARRLRAAGIIV